ncbi:hypothetical protein [Streptomyces sp. G1]|uniref:hypothetical protein n=1 Tax=Streptomyces sp. G1 TaxID=361572 RepID=UPI00203020A3|nr:hypothetical protein [Streptomyces sp. G1]MCM1964890.1 hypothetical protein [Streptomyces sp. G1]
MREGSGSAAANEGERVAAAGGAGAAPDGMSPEDMQAVRAVESLLPGMLRELLPYGQLPKRNRPALLQVLESRTLEQLRERAQRRWAGALGEALVHSGDLRSPVGAALALIAPPAYCPDEMCEDGTILDTGEDCRACQARQAERRAARLAGREVPTHKPLRACPLPTCGVCERPFLGGAPASAVCDRCEEELTAAAARFAPAPEALQNAPEPQEEPVLPAAAPEAPAHVPGAWPSAAVEARRAQERAAAAVDAELNITTVPLEEHPLGERLRTVNPYAAVDASQNAARAAEVRAAIRRRAA